MDCLYYSFKEFVHLFTKICISEGLLNEAGTSELHTWETKTSKLVE